MSEGSCRFRQSVAIGRIAAYLPLITLAMGLAIQVAYAAYLADRLWFFGDDWAFLLRRGVIGEHEFSIWFPHNEHWSTVPVLIFRLMFAIFGLEAYLPYALLPISAHVAIWVLVYLLLRRIEVGLWPAVVATWTGAFLAGGAGAQNVLWDFQVGFLGSGAFGLLAILLGRQSGRWRLAGAWSALILSLACSGVGLIFLGWACLEVLIRQGVPRTIVVGSVPGLTYAVWFALIGHEAQHAIKRDITAFPFRMVEGLDAVWSTALAMPGAGALVLAVLLAVVFFRPHSAEAFALAASGMGALAAAFALFAYTRSGLGEGAGAATRYLYFGVLFCIPAVALAIDLLRRRLLDRPFALPVATVVMLAMTGALGMANLNRFSDERVNTIGDLKQRIAATMRLVDEGAPVLWQMPSPDRNPDITVANLDRAGVRDDLQGVDVSPRDLLDARGQLQVAVSGSPLADLPPAGAISWSGLDPAGLITDALDSCQERTVSGEDVYLEFDVPRRGTSLALTTQDNAEIRTSLRDGQDTSESLDWDVDSGEYVTVETTASGLNLQVRVPPGQVTVCPRVENR